jgi:hypothetical protein
MRVIVITSGGILAACSNAGPPGDGVSSELAAPTGSNTASIEVIGGPMAGNHTLTSPDAACMISERFELNLGLPATDPRSRDPKALTMLAIALQDASGKGAAPHDQYGVAVDGAV